MVEGGAWSWTQVTLLYLPRSVARMEGFVDAVSGTVLLRRAPRLAGADPLDRVNRKRFAR